MKKIFFVLAVFCGLTAMAQQETIPVTEMDGTRVMTGFESMAFQGDETTFTNACIFVTDSVCTVRKDRVLSTDYDNKNISFNMLVGSLPGTKLSNIYQVEVSLRVQDHRLVYYISHMQVLPGERSLIKNPTYIDKLTPEKRQAHAEIIEDLRQSVSAAVRSMIRFIGENKPTAVTHWEEIRKGQAAKGLTFDEAKIAFGKPQFVSEKHGETQWMYSSSFYLFFKNGVVTSFIR